MFVRIVKMQFKPEKTDQFLVNFHENKEKIRNFDGCRFLELYRDKNDESIFFTYSYWESEMHLEQYRQSELFKSVWKKTKALFRKPAEAWSVDKLVTLD